MRLEPRKPNTKYTPETVVRNGKMTAEQRKKAEEAVKTLIDIFDEFPHREGLEDTPARHVRYLEQFILCRKEELKLTTFESETDEMVVVSKIPFYSLCEHHLLPFYGFATVGYIPGDEMLGLSKIPRVVEYHANRFQNQERITGQIIKTLEEAIRPQGVAVCLQARHLCMELRGVRSVGAWTSTTKISGLFKSNPSAKEEFLRYINPNFPS